MIPILVAPLPGVDDELVDRCVRFVAHTFLVDGGRWDPPPHLEPPPDPDRGQVESTPVLRALLDHAPADHRVIALSARDLFLPTLSFVFGHAQLGGRVALVSLFRLRQESYGFAPDPELLFDRVRRECAHELGHTYGLRHCPDPHCCMSLSTSIEDVDAKTPEFCRGCRALVRETQRRERAVGEAKQRPQEVQR